MAVSVDTVYQKVLALANKEQRGYITPQEFDLFASQAQLEIFENYFHDIRVAQLKPKSSGDVADEINILNERISIHRVVETTDITQSSGNYDVPLTAYAITSVNFTPSGGIITEIPEVDRRDLHYILNNPLAAPSASRPIFCRDTAGDIQVYPSSFSSNVDIHYIQKPDNPRWGYVVYNNKALYNSGTSNNFDLHPSEENNLVMRILELAGVSIKQQDLSDIALRDRANTKAEKNS